MKQGGDMGFRHFLQLSIALIHGGLMMSFSSPESARILAGSKRLEQNVVRRLFESATLFFGVLDTEALRPGGAAWELCLRVRLMHGMVRLRLLAAGDWTPEGGKPINPLHIAAGPLFFGSMVVRSLRRLGARVSDEEAEGYCLLWRYVTFLLGVPEELLGNTHAEQEFINARMLPLVFNPDHNSRRLADTLLTGFRRLPTMERIPRAMHEAIAHRLLGPELASGLGIAGQPLMRRATDAMVLGFKAYGLGLRVPGVARRAEAFGRRYMENFIRDGLAGVALDFQEHPR
jgi:hypothetical protein